MNCLHMLDINTLLVISLENIFSQSGSCLFISSMVFFASQMFLRLIRSHLFIFAFISFALGGRSKKYLAVTYVKEWSAYVFFYEFYGFQSYIRFLIHFGFIFV